MRQYLNLMGKILEEGNKRKDRTGTGTLSLFGEQLTFDLKEGFPLLTTKKMHMKSIIYELLWFIHGGTNVQWLNDHGVTIWDEWADENGDLGPIYGSQWRSWPNYEGGYIDQIGEAIDRLRINPTDRRMVVSAWNPAHLPFMALPPCHLMFQFYSREMSIDELVTVYNDYGPSDLSIDSIGIEDYDIILDLAKNDGVPTRYLSCLMYQRSADYFLGVPFNIASYALLTHMVASVTNHIPDRFIHTFGDVHLYLNHIEQVHTQLRRIPKNLPILDLRKRDEIDDFVYEDIGIDDYDPYPVIKAPISI